MDSQPGYSLWIGPARTELLGKRLQSIVDHYSSQLGTPRWQAHITLLGQLPGSAEEVLEKVRCIAKGFKPFSVGLTGIVVKDLFFQCVMAKVEETDALMSLNRACQEAFPREDNTYWPHLSLVYGSISMEARAKVKAEIESKSEWSSVVGSSCLIDTIEIWNTEGDPNGWEMAGVVKLGP